MTMETACETVAHLTKRDEFQPTASSMKAMQNLVLSSRVLAVLARDLRTSGADLSVVAEDGIVTISGTTQSAAVEEAAPAVARQVEGVREVQSKITFVPPFAAC